MGLDKTSVTFNFGKGIDTLTDPNQLPLGSFVSLQNSLFVQNEGGGKLDKRNGFTPLTSLPDGSSQYITTFKDGLVALGKDLKSYSGQSGVWSAPLPYTPVTLSTIPLSNTSVAQVHIDTAYSKNGLVCITSANQTAARAQVGNAYGYQICDAATGAVVVPFSYINTASGSLVTPFAPKVFSLGDYFSVVFGATTGTTTGNLEIINISTKNLSSVSAASLITANYHPMNTSSFSSFDGVVASNSLYLSWSGANNTLGVLNVSIGSSLAIGTVRIIASSSASVVSVCADTTKSPPTIWTSSYVIGTNTGQIVATAGSGSTLFSAQAYTCSQTANLASFAQNGVMTLFSEIPKTYGYGTVAMTNYISRLSIDQATNSVSDNFLLTRNLGLASKAFTVLSTSYAWGVQSSPLQSTYFLLNSTGATLAKLEYGNAPGYIGGTLPSVTVTGSTAAFGYIYNTSIATASKLTNVASQTQTTAVFSVTGTALGGLDFSGKNIITTELGNNLNVNGGFLWSYDGQTMAEHNFHLFPENVVVTSVNSGGSVIGQNYFYQAIYTWRDAKGNIFRSAPSIPYQVSLGAGNWVNTINVPNLRITNKALSTAATTSPIFIELYRWSTNQQNYFKLNSTANDTTNDTTIITDSFTDAQILGNDLLYTTGGILEDTGTPACTSLTSFDSRLWLIDSENDSLLWYSKPCVQGAPVEMGDLQTYFVPPNVSGTQSTGGVKSLAAMDDKLILFKRNSIYYINGTGPDATGANSQYSPPIFVTGGVGCSNQKSIVLSPNGLMFQSDKGIWLLGRDLSLNFIGKECEDFNTSTVLSAFVVPGTNEARFTLGSSGQTLSYDYFAGQWDQFTGVTNISSTVYQNQHTFLTSSGSVSQQSTTSYADGGTPTTMSFTTGWINLAGLQGYVRAYRMYLLGKFYTPHTYTMGIAYDYNPTIVQTATINPTNSVGSGSFVEQWQVNFQNQQTQAFQLTFNEIASSSAGQGLSLSGIKLVVGVKKDFPRNIGVSNKTG